MFALGQIENRIKYNNKKHLKLNCETKCSLFLYFINFYKLKFFYKCRHLNYAVFYLEKRLYMVSYIGFQLNTKTKIIIYNIDREKKNRRQLYIINYLGLSVLNVLLE